MNPNEINKFNQKKYTPNKINKYCPQCEQIYHVSDYISKCPVCKSFLEYCPQPQNIPHCPTCGSTDIKKISTTNRLISVAAFGLASSKIGKQFECKKCGYKW